MLQLNLSFTLFDLALQDEEAITRRLAEVQIVAQDISFLLGTEDRDATDVGYVVIVRRVILK